MELAYLVDNEECSLNNKQFVQTLLDELVTVLNLDSTNVVSSSESFLYNYALSNGGFRTYISDEVAKLQEIEIGIVVDKAMCNLKEIFRLSKREGNELPPIENQIAIICYELWGLTLIKTVNGYHEPDQQNYDIAVLFSVDAIYKLTTFIALLHEHLNTGEFE